MELKLHLRPVAYRSPSAYVQVQRGCVARIVPMASSLYRELSAWH